MQTSLNMKEKKSQSSIEFLIFLGVALIILIVFSIINLTYLNFNLKQRESTSAQDLAKLIKNEINLASRVEPGYIRTVTLPIKLDNKEYSISMQQREVYVFFTAIEEQDFTERLATNVAGVAIDQVNTGNNILTIKKCYDISETVRINSDC